MLKNWAALILSFIFFTVNSYAGSKYGDSLLLVLDYSLDCQDTYDSEKEKKIAGLKAEFLKALSVEETHKIYLQIFKEYEAYIFDSATFYAYTHLQFSLNHNDLFWINECKMQLARMYSTFAQFQESINLLNSINKKELESEQLGAYYSSFAEVYIYWSEYTYDDDQWQYIALKDTYQDSALMVLKKGTYEYDLHYARRCIETKDFARAEAVLLPYLNDIKLNTRDYAILTSLIAYLYELKGDVNLQKEYLVMSSIADLRASVKENTSIGTLALLLLNEGDINRANRYIKSSLEDANFYNARLRNVQVGKILPIIDKAYQIEREAHQKNLHLSLISIGILLLFLMGVLFYLIQQMKRLSNTRKELIYANDELKTANRHLHEANHIKDEYIGRFLNQCSVYIDKLEAYQKVLNKKAASGKLDELFQMLKSSQIIDGELKQFYQSFDSTFLNLFPNFVEQFNQLLPEEDRVKPKNENCLTPELRIFALIRLGITDSAKIASFLRYSITTIYNYRSKYRNKAIIPREEFESIIMNFSSLNITNH